MGEIMLQLIKFELHKLLCRPLVYASLAGFALFLFVMEWNWVYPGTLALNLCKDGSRICLTGSEAIIANQKIAAKYYGSLTDEKVQDIIKTYDMPDSYWEAYDLDPEREGHYTHNLIYDTMSVYGYVRLDGSYNGATVEEIFGSMAPELILGYSAGWEDTIYVFVMSFMTWGCILVIILSPIFSEEYTRHMDALILTGIHGRKKCILAKITASLSVTVLSSLMLFLAGLLTLFLSQGFVGYDSSVQLGELQFLAKTPYLLNWLQCFGLGCLAWFLGMLALTVMVLVVSALAKNSFSALVIAFTLFVLPMFLPWHNMPAILTLAGYLLPVNQIRLDLILSLDLISLGSLQFSPVFLAVPVTAIILAAGLPLARKSFAGHQVM